MHIRLFLIASMVLAWPLQARAAMDGAVLYETHCAACHQVTGLGLPPAFPALKDSPMVNGPIADHLDIVIKGKEGTAMQPWGSLNNLEIAAIVTYERNAWDNNTGDVVQPADVKQAR